ncbi:MAG: phosphatase PAP2 family protein [Burkholderiaceae bacterium]
MHAVSPYAFWVVLTRLGEVQIALPLALLGMVVLLRNAESRALAVWWMVLLTLAIALTTATKLAFIGWGLGWPALDFTGVSGHAMFAAAVYPLLLGCVLAAPASRQLQTLAIVAGCALALLVGISRVVVGAHSVSEVIAGLCLGGLVSALPLGMLRRPRVRVGPVVPAMVLVFAALMPTQAPASLAHPLVVRLALLLSGNAAPFTRADMLRMSGLPSG